MVNIFAIFIGFKRTVPPEPVHRKLGGKKWFLTGLNGIYLPVGYADWLLVVVALLLVGQFQICYVKIRF